MKKLFNHKILNSKITSNDITKSEQILGYFIGPCLVYLVYTGIAGTYLTQFYTDVLKISGNILTFMPLLSKIICIIISFVFGRIIDNTKTAQGKARPWILLSGVLLTIFGILLYAVPNASNKFQIIWVIVSYNLYFDIAFNMYSLSHSLMIPLSTRNIKQRDSLAMLTSTAISMIPGILSTLIMPILINKIGVGDNARNAWLMIMGLLSIIAIPATLIEYYFTLERITSKSNDNDKSISFKQQLKACFHNKNWMLIIMFSFVITMSNTISNNSMLYYCNWVLANSIESGATKQILVNVIGQFPLGIGVVGLWPLVKKYGKQKVIKIGFLIAMIGSFLVFINSNNFILVLIFLFIKSIGAIPNYVISSMQADAQDNVEKINGFRVDGLSASIISNIPTLSTGLAQTILLAGINNLGYVAPSTTNQIINQSTAISSFFNWCFIGIPMIGYLIGVIIMCTYKGNN